MEIYLKVRPAIMLKDKLENQKCIKSSFVLYLQSVWTHDILSGLVWVQTVCKDTSREE